MSGEDTVLTRVNGRPTVLNIEDNVHLYTNSSGAVAVGDVVYVTSNNTVAKADADGTAYPPIGLVQTLKGSTECYVVHSGGIATGLSGLTAGKPYYLSNTAGVLSATPSGAATYLIGVAINATSLAVSCVSTNLCFVDGGNNVMVIGASTDPSTWTAAPVSGDGLHVQDKNIVIGSNTADAFSSVLAFNKSRHTTDGSHTIAVSGDTVGEITFLGSDGTNFELCAQIKAEVDGTPGNNDMPGRLVLSTTADGATSPTERVRIDSTGNVGIGGVPGANLHAYGTDTRIRAEASSNNRPGFELSENGSRKWIIYNESNDDTLRFKDASDRVVIDTNGNMGIGTVAPQSTLHLEHTDTTAWPVAGASNEQYTDFLLTLRNNTNTVDAFAGIAFDVSTETDADSIGAAIVATCADSTSTQHDTDLAFATNLVSDDDLTERMRITAAGRVGFGTSNPEDGIDSTYAMYASQGDSYCLKLHNDGDSNARRGLYIACGSDDSLGTNYAIAFADGNDTWQGSIKFTGGTTSYMAFTAAHSAEVPEGHTYTYGTVMCVTSAVSNDRAIVYNVTQSTSAMQTSVIGCYSDDNGGVAGPSARHSVCAVGDGHVLVCSEGGNIEIGDYICSSNTAGHGMKQSGGSMMNYTVAKAFESVDWSTEGSSTKLIACTYHSG